MAIVGIEDNVLPVDWICTVLIRRCIHVQQDKVKCFEQHPLCNKVLWSLPISMIFKAIRKIKCVCINDVLEFMT